MFILRQLLRVLVTITAFHDIAYAISLTNEQLAKCKSIQREEILRAATKNIIDLGRKARASGIPDSQNPWPFNDFTEMISKYPDCCSISTKFVGDYDPRIRPHFDGGLSFKAYFVRIRIPSVGVVEGNLNESTYDRTVIVTCFGQAITEDKLIHMGE